jgi:Dihaem cytochrome c
MTSSRDRKLSRKTRKTTRRQSMPAAIGLVILLILFTMLMGVGLAQALEPKLNPLVQAGQKIEVGTVDPVSDRDRLGQELYLDSCKSCHLAIPPAVMPTQTWQALLQDPQHYGATIDLPQGPERKILWNYLRNASRPIANKEERIPYRIADSRYFKALHPKVKFETKAKLTTCITCHPSATDFNFRKLSAEAEKSS